MKKMTLYLGALVFLTWMCSSPPKEDDGNDDVISGPFVRYNASTDSGAIMLNAMSKGMGAIESLPCTNPISWYYQGAIHWIPDSVKNGNPFCKEYQVVADTLKAWRNCTHIPGDNDSDFQFLIWHRLYIWHLEKIVRAYSGDPRFALPYWDYVNPAFRTMPLALRTTTSDLFTDQRLTSLNLGDPIEEKFSKEFLVKATAAAFQSPDYADFNSQIDAAPHGAMHDYIGGAYSQEYRFNTIYQDTINYYIDDGVLKKEKLAGWMSHVPSAGFDPVFWLHHANIDYLWSLWEGNDVSKRPSWEEFSDHPWSFVFPEPDGSFKTYGMKEAYETAFNPDYIYDGGILKELQIAAENSVSAVADQQPELLHAQTSTIEVGDGKTLVPLTGGLKDALTESATNLLKANTGPVKYNIRIKVSFDEQPTGGYVVYLSDSNDPSKVGEYVGSLTFFGAAVHAGHHEDGLGKTFIFNITDELDSAGDTPHLIFERLGGNGVPVTIEEISIFKQ